MLSKKTKEKVVRKQYQQMLTCGVGKCSLGNPCKTCRELHDTLDKHFDWNALENHYQNLALAQRRKLPEKELAELLKTLHYDEQYDKFYMVCEALRKKNPFNEVLQDNWWCWGKNWFKWITQGMNEKDRAKQKHIDKERVEDFERRWKDAEKTGVLLPPAEIL